MRKNSARVRERVKRRGLVILALALCACASNSEWRPETKPWVRYNLQFVEGKKFIATWVRPFGRGRTNREAFWFGDVHEFQIKGLEYAFYEGDYGADSTLRRIGTHKTLQKVEITATADSLILTEFPSDGGADMVWLDRRTGEVGKEIKGISAGPYRLGEFQMRLNHPEREGDAPTLSEDRVLLTSVRPWGENQYLLDLGNFSVPNRARGNWTDFTKPNEFAPQPFILLDTRSKSFSPFNPDSVFGIGSRYWVEVWKSGTQPVGVHFADESKSLVLVKGGLETDTLALREMGLDSLRLATFARSESRGTFETSHTWGPWFDVALSGDAFGAGLKRGPFKAPDGVTEWNFHHPELPIEFVNPANGTRITFADPSE